MAKITFENKTYSCNPSESVLDCLRRHGVPYPFSCQSGVCQSCLSVCKSGDISADAQQGLKPTQAAQKYFLACLCMPEQDIELTLPEANEEDTITTRVTGKTLLNNDIVKLSLARPDDYNYFPGQFLNLRRDDTLIRSYSIASVPELDNDIELHIRKLPNGQVSSWVHDELSIDDKVTISSAKGDCFYVADKPDQNLLLLGTGSGLAPLYGIIRDALNKGHNGEIKLYHGSYTAAGLYLIDELRALATEHKNFHYISCVSDDENSKEHTYGLVNDNALKDNPDLKNWRVFLCGHPDMVAQSKKQVFLAGVSFSDIYSDPFLISS